MNLADYAKERANKDDDEDESDDKDELYAKIGKLVCEAIKLTMKVEAANADEDDDTEDDDSE